MAGILLENLTGVHLQFVPYRGAAPGDAGPHRRPDRHDVRPGLEFATQVRAGAVRAYAVTAKTRLASAPEIPTADEAGVPGLYATVWNGFWVPKATPPEIVAKLNAAAVDALADPAVRRRLADLGLEIPPRDQQTPQALAAQQKADAEKWWPIIKAANIKME